MKKNTKIFFLLVLFQIIILTFMVLNSYTIILWGEKINLKIQPVDPHSLFQGDYVRLNYPFNTIDLNITDHDLNLDEARNQEPVYLVLEKEKNDSYWSLAFVTQNKASLQDKIYLKGKIEYISIYPMPTRKPEPAENTETIDAKPIETKPIAAEPFETKRMLHVSLGIETFFVPEGKGLDIENKIREGVMYAQVAVYKGQARVIDLISQ